MIQKLILLFDLCSIYPKEAMMEENQSERPTEENQSERPTEENQSEKPTEEKQSEKPTEEERMGMANPEAEGTTDPVNPGAEPVNPEVEGTM
jgi:hypothetical protein